MSFEFAFTTVWNFFWAILLVFIIIVVIGAVINAVLDSRPTRGEREAEARERRRQLEEAEKRAEEERRIREKISGLESIAREEAEEIVNHKSKAAGRVLRTIKIIFVGLVFVALFSLFPLEIFVAVKEWYWRAVIIAIAVILDIITVIIVISKISEIFAKQPADSANKELKELKKQGLSVKTVEDFVKEKKYYKAHPEKVGKFDFENMPSWKSKLFKTLMFIGIAGALVAAIFISSLF